MLVRLDSPGPVLFEQTRVGLRGKTFRLLKFRTMYEGAEIDQPSIAHLNVTDDSRLFKIVDDPRVTRLGTVLRRWSLDELPQLVNILMGEMSLVGPRPFFESDLDDYEAHHFRRLAMKPGLTGLWQVSGRSDIVDFEEVVRLDRAYIEGWSLALDFRILALTIPTVVRRKGAY
jgi:lipopolysaccharide/colanic/teichoic acid biosynthesis glycosyltransferase